MPVNGSDDITPGPTADDRIKNPANRELVTFLGNLVVEARSHLITLRGLYEALREMAGSPPISWKADIVKAQEDHVTRMTGHVAEMKAAVGSG
jgi:hypothetical protein